MTGPLLALQAFSIVLIDKNNKIWKVVNVVLLLIEIALKVYGVLEIHHVIIMITLIFVVDFLLMRGIKSKLGF